MKKIVISSNTSWSIYNFRLNLGKTLKEKGYKVVIVAPKDKYSDIIKKEFEYYDIFIDSKGTNPINDLRTLWQYYRIYKKTNPDIVLNFTIKPNIYGSFVASLLNIKTVNNITGLGTLFIKETFASKIAKFLYRISLKRSSFIFFQNKDDFELFKGLDLIDVEKCDILPGSGVDVEKFKPVEINKQDNIFRFLLIARMVWDKGIGEYIEAARIIKQKYKNVEFLLLGPIGVDNPTAISKSQIEEWEEERAIKYLGVSDYIRREIAEADCIVLPSYREGTSRVLLEAASMAKPLIASDVPGCNNVVENRINGFLCKVKDAKDLADKIEKMLNLSEGERIEMGRRGREKIIKEFDEKFVIEKYLNAVEKLLN